jgi:aspartyl/asparaginyl beta-hydroxylase (cupin superfamily)
MKWVPWPEDHFSKSTTEAEEKNANDWTVFPLLHTFPACDASKSTWIDSTCNSCPLTTNLLKNIPGIRTALFSKLGAGTNVLNIYFFCFF